MSQAHIVQNQSRLFVGLVTILTSNQQRHRDVFQRGEFWQQMMKLIYKSKRGIAQCAERRLRQLADVLTLQRHAALRNVIQPAEQVQQRALARAGGADDGKRLAGVNIEVDAEQNRHLDFPLQIGFVQVTTREHQVIVIHSAMRPPV